MKIKTKALLLSIGKSKNETGFEKYFLKGFKKKFKGGGFKKFVQESDREGRLDATDVPRPRS